MIQLYRHRWGPSSQLIDFLCWLSCKVLKNYTIINIHVTFLTLTCWSTVRVLRWTSKIWQHGICNLWLHALTWCDLPYIKSDVRASLSTSVLAAEHPSNQACIEIYVTPQLTQQHVHHHGDIISLQFCMLQVDPFPSENTLPVGTATPGQTISIPSPLIHLHCSQAVAVPRTTDIRDMPVHATAPSVMCKTWWIFEESWCTSCRLGTDPFGPNLPLSFWFLQIWDVGFLFPVRLALSISQNKSLPSQFWHSKEAMSCYEWFLYPCTCATDTGIPKYGWTWSSLQPLLTAYRPWGLVWAGNSQFPIEPECSIFFRYPWTGLFILITGSRCSKLRTSISRHGCAWKLTLGRCSRVDQWWQGWNSIGLVQK